MNRYPAKPMMDEMAKYGRYGDTMLVHMNPAEVAGIASLVPGGRLTTNPVTGQPEAFLPLLFGALGGALKLGTLGTAALTGVGTAAVTGDVKRGLLAGLTAGAASGIGEALAGVKEGVDAAQVVPDVVDAAPDVVDAASEGVQLIDAAGPNTFDFGGNRMFSDIGGSFKEITPGAPSAPSEVIGGSSGIAEVAPQNFSQKIFGGAEDVVNKGLGSLGTTGQLAIAGVGQGSIEQMKMEDQMRRQAEALRAEGEADRREAYDDLQRGYARAQPGIPTGLSGARSEMSRRTPPPMYMSEGGKTYPGGQDENPYANQYAGLGAARDIARFIGGPRGYMGVDPVRVQQRLRGQDVIAPPRVYMPGFEPEFNYFQNLERDDDGNIIGTPEIPDRSYRPMRQGVISRSQYFDPVLQAPQSNAQMNEYRRTLEKLDPSPLDIGSVMGLASEGSVLSPQQQGMLESYYNYIPPPVTTQPDTTESSSDTANKSVTDMSAEELAEKYPTLTEDQIEMIRNLDVSNILSTMGNFMPFAEGGDVPIKTSMMQGSVPDGGIARVPTEFTQQAMPSEQEMSMLAMAVLGQTENPDPIINMFVDKYGPDMFRQARQMILESVVPNAQTEGMVRGNGSGMDDKVQGMIGKDQPVAVSPGEYIVAADVVSGLGEGSSDAGARELDKMMDKVRMERNGTTQQAPRIDERKVMPA